MRPLLKKRLLLGIFFVLVVINLVLASWNVLHGDILFNSEIARDFHLLQEAAVKKIVLIGPSSSTGLFHGPLWTYTNLPAYLLGDGNPVVVGWYWILLVVVYLISGFYFVKKLFNNLSAYLFVLMNSLYFVFHAKGFYNPHGAMLLAPAFFYFFIQYLKTYKLKYLLIHILITGAMVQYQLAVGIPFAILSFVYIAVNAIRRKKFTPILAFIFILVPIANFIVFDIRHDFLLSKLVMRYIVSPSRDHPNYLFLLSERIRLMLGGTEILRLDQGNRNLGLFGVLLVFLVDQIKKKKFVTNYLVFLYFYCGFFLVSLINTGPILYFYQFPLFPLVFIVFSSFATSRFKSIFLTIFAIVYLLNFNTALSDIRTESTTIGKTITSWKFYNEVGNRLFSTPEKEFGYFVYAPNAFAYEGKYAVLYAQKQSQKKAIYFTKHPVTYLVVAPPPSDNPHMKDDFWRVEQLHITASASSTIRFENGYKIEKYNLSAEEVKTPFDQAADPGLTFR